MDNNEKSRRVRKTKDISQKEMAAKLKISQSTVSKRETGRIKLTETKMKEIADSLGVTPEEIKDFTGKNIAINVGDNNGDVSVNEIQLLQNHLQIYEKLCLVYEQLCQEKDRNSALQAKIIELLEKEK